MAGAWDFWNNILGFVGHSCKKGKIVVSCGCMNAAKSLWLLIGLFIASSRGRKIQAFIPQNAMPQGRDVIESRAQSNGHVMSLPAMRLSDPFDILKHLEPDTQVIGIDEAHFWDLRLVKVCDELVRRGIVVLVAGLDQDFRGKSFPDSPIPGLMVRAVHVDKLQGACELCGRPSTRSQRYNEKGEVASWEEPTVKEAKGGYKGLCDDCWVEPPGRPDELVEF